MQTANDGQQMAKFRQFVTYFNFWVIGYATMSKIGFFSAFVPDT